jgi:bacterial/archaeal transporter family protein
MNFESWQVWAVLSAVFAALTAIFAKIGVENINSDLATFIRTVVVLFSFLVLLLVTGQFVRPEQISARTWTFLILSGLATGASWLCYPRPQIGPGIAGRAGRQAQRGVGRDLWRAGFR